MYFYWISKTDGLVKSPKLRHAPASAGAGSAKAGIQNYLKILDSRFRGNDAKGRIKTFYETINIYSWIVNEIAARFYMV